MHVMIKDHQWRLIEGDKAHAGISLAGQSRITL